MLFSILNKLPNTQKTYFIKEMLYMRLQRLRSMRKITMKLSLLFKELLIRISNLKDFYFIEILQKECST